ncbi:serine/arginine repetitive matrix protein 1-like [Oenanthe melanoleuca]|uniref:serine/arginine repetitive matrix protein 1-like n=1 Tax=Oenanthe melanoleuca TaxID=2939378 RepID=UPI0024C14C7D|nr:serine/arginine repetitive matrix protein 1-like [Oenanthe melanoleuca]XP_056344290.1 serine/arginine repetitive matrix protein 1-like [Oenanthe melanoleuca]
MASEEDLEGSGTSFPASSTSQVSRAAHPGASENLRCPICRAPMNDRASVSWRRHPFCFYCTVEWFHRRVDGLIHQSLFQHAFHTVGDSNSEVQPTGESTSSASHTPGVRAGSRSAERHQHHSSGRQHRKSSSRSRGGSRGGSCRGRAREKSRSRCPRRHHGGRARHSSSRRRQSRARDKGRAPRTLPRRRKRRQQEFQVSFIEPRAVRSRSRQRSRSSSSRTLREYLRKMERDEGRALRQDCYMRASSARSRRQQQQQRVSYREPQVARSRTPRRLRSTMPLKENPVRMEHYERQPSSTEHASPRGSEHLQQGSQVPFIKPQVTSQPQGMACSTLHQAQQEDQRRMEHDEGQAPTPEGDTPSSSEWSERHQQGSRISFTEP